MTQRHAETLKTTLMKQLRPALSQGPYFRAPQLLLSVSGGMDSMVLLDVFQRMQHVHLAPLGVLHIHHHTGRFADLAAELVQNHCRQADLPCRVVHWQWDGDGNFEYEAASFRRTCLEQWLEPGGFAVLAHHRDDQVETFLQTLVRGAGATTRLGMRSRRGRRLRPFLHQSRRLIAEHAERAGVPHMLDPSNIDESRFRNAVRRRVVPVLASFHQDFAGHLDGWLEDYNALRDGLSEQGEEMFRRHYHYGVLQRKVFEQAAPWMWDFILAYFWEACGVNKPVRGNRDRLHGWLAGGEIGRFDHQGRRFWCDSDGLTFHNGPAGAQACRLGEAVTWGDWVFRVARGARAEHCPFPEQCEEFELLPDQPFPKAFREILRKAGAPHRIRAILPAMRIGDRDLDFGEILALMARGGLVLQQVSGPDVLRFLDLDKGESSA